MDETNYISILCIDVKYAQMKELNIWGRPDCELPNGKLCNVCCVLSKVELDGTIFSIVKPAFTPCSNLNCELDSGCSLHLQGKPENCKNWHCGFLGDNYRRDIIACALAQNLVTEEEAIEAIDKLGRGKEWVKEMFRKSNVFSGKIKKRDLIIGDINEP